MRRTLFDRAAADEPAGWIQPVQERAQGVHDSHSFHQPPFGLGDVRLPRCFPFPMRVGRNGRPGRCQQRPPRGVPCPRRANLLVAVAAAALAQPRRDEQRHADGPTRLPELVPPVQPLGDDWHATVHPPSYETTAASAWATGVVFRTPAELARWDPRGRRHGIETLPCPEVRR